MNEKTDLNIDKLQRDIYNLTQKKWGIKLNLGWGIKLNLDIIASANYLVFQRYQLKYYFHSLKSGYPFLHVFLPQEQ